MSTHSFGITKKSKYVSPSKMPCLFHNHSFKSTGPVVCHFSLPETIVASYVLAVGTVKQEIFRFKIANNFSNS